MPYRPRRVEELLSLKEKFSVQDMLDFQKDSLLIHARETLPGMLALLKASKDETEQKAVSLLRQWDDRFLRTSVAATIYDSWFNEFRNSTWLDKLPSEEESWIPNWDVTAKLLRENPKSKWFDQKATPEVETAEILVNQSFHSAVEKLKVQMGPDVSKWIWGRKQPAHFDHLSKIPGLGAESQMTVGHPYTVFSNRSEHGPVWSSVVALGPTVRAWGVYPGGQSGNPVSRYYETFLTDWSQNQLKEIDFLSAEQPLLKDAMTTLAFASEKEGEK